MNVVLLLDGQDSHDEGCDCGLCNANGKSYSAGVYPSTAGGITTGDVLERIYACSETSAMNNARLYCKRNNYVVVQQTAEEDA